MIVGLGTDIVEIQRVDDSVSRLGDAFAQRILTPSEFLLYQSSRHATRYLAKRFCVKEAAAKALGTGIGRGISWQHFQVENDNDGAPLLNFSAGAEKRLNLIGGSRALVSISDEVHYATAVVILES